ncbi:hypothetical protein ACQV5M_19770, partial [Leptospira sp. SA-E8]|uniref:hypothetical protein n=1 Tax=Leptospira sp. SA-E8 TaxID=3422259 RepID=UPI003EBFC621
VETGMRHFMNFVLVFLLFMATKVCAGDIDVDLGLVPIGGVPKDLSTFTSTDCESSLSGYADCSAQDQDGRRYSFFGGSLSKVSIAKNEVKTVLKLPAKLRFGDDIAHSVEMVSNTFNIKINCGKSQSGNMVCSSDFVLMSSIGVLFSLEMIADDQRKLVEIIERTDF